jgi:hypothetical protein
MIVGQKVVCVNDRFDPDIAKFYIALPKKDVVYVIREVKIGVSPAGSPGEVCIYLIALNNPRSNEPPFPERGFNAERFRPLDEVQEEARRQQGQGRDDGRELVEVAVPTHEKPVFY